MTTDKWVRERARSLQTYHGGTLVHIQDVIAFGHEAIERTRTEERANAAEALKLAKEMQDKAVAAERERTLDAVIQAFEKGRRDVVERLENPDEALVEAVAKPHCDNDWPCRRCRENAEASIRALARTLTEGKETT